MVTTVYFNDDTSSVSADDVLDLVTKFCGAIKDLEGIEDTLDPCTTIAITPIPTGDGVSAVQGDQFQPTTRISSAAVVGVALAALALLLVILFAARSKQRERYIEKHHSLDEEFDDETYLKDDYEKSSFKSDMERSSLGNISPERSPLAVGGARPSIAGQGRSASYFSPSTSSRPSPERTQSFPDMRRTHIIGEADSMISSWDNYTPNRPMSAPPVIKSFHNLRVDQDGLVDVHKCSSATCEVCEANRQSGLEFVPIGMPSHSNSYEQIPSMGSSREYVAGDTVDL